MADYTLSVKIDGDASGLEKEAEKAKKALQDIAKESGDVSKDISSKSGEAEKGIEKIGDQSQETAQKIASEAQEAGQSIEKIGETSQQTANKMSTELSNGGQQAEQKISAETQKAEQAVEKIGSASQQAANEMSSAFENGGKQAEQSIENIATTSGSVAQRVASAFGGVFSSLGGGVKNGLTTAGQGLTALGGKFESAGKQMTDSGKAMSMGLTAPLVGVYKFSKSAFNEVDAGMDTVVKKTGATGDALESLQGSVQNVATTIPTSFETAGQAVGEVNTRFGLTGDALDDLSGKFVKFAELNGTDVSASVDATQQIIEAFGLTTEDAGNLLDTFNKVGQDTGVNLDALMGSMVQNSAAFKEMGFGAADSAKFLGQLEVSGADSTQVMAGLKKALQNAAKEGVPMNEALAQVQESLTGAESDTEATALAMELFGAKAGPAIAKAVREGKLSFDDLGASLTDAAGNIDTTFENTQDGADKMTLAMNRIKASSSDLSEQVDKTLAPIMERLASGIEWVSKKFSELSPETQQVIVTIGMLLAVIGPLLLIFGAMSTAIGGLIGANGLGGLLIALGGLNAPVLAIIGVITILVGVFATLWNTNEEFRTRITEIWTELGTIFSEFFGKLKTQFEEWGLTTENLKAAWEAFCNFLAPILTVAFEVIKEVIRFALDYILGLIKIFHGLFTGNWDEVWEGAKQILDAAVTLFKNLFGDLVTKLVEKAKELGGKIKEKFTEIKDGVVEKVTELKEKAIEIWENLKESVGDKVGDIRDKIEEGFNDAVDFITSLPGQAYDWGADIINSIADGIWGAIGSVTSAVSSVADTIWSYLHFSEPEIGPLSDFHTWMPDLMSGLAEGMKHNMPTLKAGVDLVANTMSGIIPGTGTAGRYDGGDNGGTHNNWGGVSITVNAAEGQDEEAVADAVMRRMLDLVAAEV